MQHHDVVIVGAGLAGLIVRDRRLPTPASTSSCWRQATHAGGRVRTDQVDGFLLDHGFQLLNPAYPALPDFVDLDALDLRAFGAGVVVAVDGERHVIADPRRSLSDLASGVRPSNRRHCGEGALRRLRRQVSLRSASSLKRREDIPYGEALDRAGIRGRLRDAVVNPFLAGVLGEDHQESSRVFVDLLLRTFARGTPAVPAAGMQALPAQLAERLPSGALRLGSETRPVATAW